MIEKLLAQKCIFEEESASFERKQNSYSYLLLPRYELRSWKNMTVGLVDRVTGITRKLSNLEGLALLLCNGKVDFSLSSIPQTILITAKRFTEERIVSRCLIGASIQKYQECIIYPVNYLIGAKWAITGKCNLKCKHCFVSAPNAKFGELSIEECFRIIDDLARIGIHRVILTGGEPLLRRDFYNIVDYLLKNDIVISTIATNGILVNDRLLDFFESRGIRPKFNMSFDGLGWHDWLRGIDGSETILMKRFELLHNRGYATGSAMSVHKHNLHSMKETMDKLISVGCQEMICNRVTGFGEWDKMGERLSVSPKELFDAYLDLIEHYYKIGRKIRIVMNRFFKSEKDSLQYSIMPYKNCKNGLNSFVCNDIHNSIFISADGKVMPCLAVSSVDEIHNLFPNVLEHSLEECLESPVYKRYTNYLVSDFIRNNLECQNCPYAQYCLGGCRAQALDFNHEDYLSRDIPNCVFFSNNYTQKIVDLIREVCPDANCKNLPEDL